MKALLAPARRLPPLSPAPIEALSAPRVAPIEAPIPRGFDAGSAGLARRLEVQLDNLLESTRSASDAAWALDEAAEGETGGGLDAAALRELTRVACRARSIEKQIAALPSDLSLPASKVVALHDDLEGLVGGLGRLAARPAYAAHVASVRTALAEQLDACRAPKVRRTRGSRGALLQGRRGPRAVARRARVEEARGGRPPGGPGRASIETGYGGGETFFVAGWTGGSVGPPLDAWFTRPPMQAAIRTLLRERPTDPILSKLQSLDASEAGAAFRAELAQLPFSASTRTTDAAGSRDESISPWAR